jgi:hypothetical protein
MAMPINEGDRVRAAISISFYKTAIPSHEIAERIVAPLRATRLRIEEAFAFVNAGQGVHDVQSYDNDMGF